MSLLVTGAMGHVGYAIVRRAAARGLDVVAQYRESFRAGDAAAAGSRVRWVACDLADPDALRTLASAHGIDRCIHAAAVSNEAFARPAPLAAVTSNVSVTARLLEAARLAAWARFVLVGTGSVFQTRTDTASPILEDAPAAVANVYSTTKHAAELLAAMYRSQYALSAATVRISWVFGPPVASDSPTRGPIPSYLMRALSGMPVREGGGDFCASFTYIDDVADGLLAAATAPRLAHPVYHLGSGRNVTAREAAAAVARAVPGSILEIGGGTEPWTRYTALRGPLAGTRLAEDTGFRVGHSLDAAVAAYAAWMRAHPEAWAKPA